jgi:hypothetical protein
LEEKITPLVAAKGSKSTKGFWYVKFKSGGALDSKESLSVTVTADTAFEYGLEVRGP